MLRQLLENLGLLPGKMYLRIGPQEVFVKNLKNGKTFEQAADKLDIGTEDFSALLDLALHSVAGGSFAAPVLFVNVIKSPPLQKTDIEPFKKLLLEKGAHKVYFFPPEQMAGMTDEQAIEKIALVEKFL